MAARAGPQASAAAPADARNSRRDRTDIAPSP
jgi:hypothetical protein